MRDAFAHALYEAAQESQNVYFVVADISPAASLDDFRKEFPTRFLDVGVSEQALIGVCAGLAMKGFRPFAYTIATFSVFRPYEQIRVDLSYQNLPVTVVGVGGGVAYSSLGGTHHAQEDIALMNALPNMTILAPCDPLEVRECVLASMKVAGPVYLRLGKAGEPVLTKNSPDPFVLGKLRCIRAGERIAILTYGAITRRAFEIAEKFRSEGHGEIAIYSVATLKPLDREGIEKVLKNFDQILVLEEHIPSGGLGMMTKQVAWDSQAKCKLKTFSLQDAFLHSYGSQFDLWDKHGLSVENLYQSLISSK